MTPIPVTKKIIRNVVKRERRMASGSKLLRR